MAKLTTVQRNRLSTKQFALPKTRQYPINDKGHAQYAVRIASIQHARGNLSTAGYNQIINAVNKKFGFNAKPKAVVKTKRAPIKGRK